MHECLEPGCIHLAKSGRYCKFHGALIDALIAAARPIT